MRDSTTTDYPLSIAAWLVTASAMLSGPLGFVTTLHEAQPAWRDARVYAEHAHRVQQLPFWFGFLMIVSCVLLVARMASLAFDHHRTRSFLAIVAIAVYASLISINYALQVAYVPALVQAHDNVLAYVTMTNPTAPTWVLEMFGYAVLGLATAILAPAIAGHSWRRRTIRGLLRANGAISILGALVTAVDLAWVQTPAGLVCFLGWNALMITATALIGFEYIPPGRRSDAQLAQ
ncbi:MAG: hypothetical protein ABJE66_06990 [Deltaproteobacteria bacterium]